ncbi:hypothetical protein JCM8097_004611 [Rhodosporidiobolus ruineniae]
MLLDGVAETLADSLGASVDQIKTILILVGSVPLSLVFPYLPPSTRSSVVHLYSILPSILFLCFILDLRWGFLELVGDAVATWVICKVGVAQKWGRAMPWAVFTVVMGHLAYNHIRVFLRDVPSTTIDIGGSHMVMVMKLISFAWSVYDGQRPEAELDATQKATKLDSVPGLLPFLGFALYFPSIMAGPSYTYRAYESFTSHRLYVKEQGSTSSGKADPTVIPPGRKRKCLKRFITGIVFLGIFSVYSGQLGMEKLLDKEFVASKTFWQRFLHMNIAGFIARTKYYAVWCIAESAYIIAGFGYNPQTKHYDASRNVRIRSIELAPNFKVLLDSWNMNTNVWLRECIYKRVAKKGRKPGFKSTQITFITSALWHGVNPCYLMTFVLGGFCQALNRSLRAGLRPFFLPPGALSNPSPAAAPSTTAGDVKVKAVAADGKVAAPKVKVAAPPQTALKTLYDIVGTLSTLVVLNFAVVPFLLLDTKASLAAWSTVHYYGLWLVFVPFLALNMGGGLRFLKGLQKQRDAKASRKLTKQEQEQERGRVEYEQQQEEKRRRRGEGVPSMGMDVERMMEEEEKEEKGGLRAKKEL